MNDVPKPTFVETHKLCLTLTVRENLSLSELYQDIFTGKQIPKTGQIEHFINQYSK